MTPGDRPTLAPFRPLADVAREIRQGLKRRFGWTRREVRIRARECGPEEVIHITIQAPGVPRSRVKHLAAPHARVRRGDDGDILGGGNRFVSVAFASEVFAAFVAPLEAKLEALPLAPADPVQIVAGRYRFGVTRFESFDRSLFVFADDYLHRACTTSQAANQIARFLGQSRQWRRLLAELIA